MLNVVVYFLVIGVARWLVWRFTLMAASSEKKIGSERALKAGRNEL